MKLIDGIKRTGVINKPLALYPILCIVTFYYQHRGKWLKSVGMRGGLNLYDRRWVGSRDSLPKLANWSILFHRKNLTCRFPSSPTWGERDTSCAGMLIRDLG